MPDIPVSNLVRLQARFGQDEVNVGRGRYRVGLDGTVLVPREAVDSLLSTGGFAMADLPLPVPTGMARLAHPEHIGCAFGGKTYEPGADGTVLVPAEAAAVLMEAHGFCTPSPALEVPVDPRDAELAALRAERDDLQTKLAAAEKPAKPKPAKAADGPTGATGPTGASGAGSTGATGTAGA
ncbi:MAG TPA: hypothetical protein VHW66_19020 [Stellaceae bacterium]|jgi:hypothetical protein|nr:hypothetical protein [Stellaceae bacterium]